MNKTELLRHVASKTGVSKRVANKVLTATLDSITEALSTGDYVQLVGFGVFQVKERAERTARNLKTNEPVKIEPKRVAVFKPGKNLREEIT